MDVKDLKAYKAKLGKLDELERKQRDVHLRKLAKGDIQGPIVGYGSIDRLWLENHLEKSLLIDFKPQSIYQMVYENNIDHLNDNMIDYFGNKIKYKDFFEKVDIVAKSLLEFGIKKNDVVMVSLPNVPEAAYLFYALNKIGAVIDSVDPRSSEKDLCDSINEFDSKYFFGIDVMLPKLKNLKNDINIVSLSPFNSLKFPVNRIMKMIKPSKVGFKHIEWKDFVKLGLKSSKDVSTPVYEKDKLAVVVHTGGSTGTPKGVMLSNENFNALIYQLKYNGMNFRRGQRFLNILPPFIALGLDNAMHLAACLGIEQILIPAFEPEQIPGLIKKYKPNILLCGPIHCNEILRSEVLKNEDLSYLEIICTGGDAHPISEQEKFQEFLKSHNAKANLWTGYGATETSAGNCCIKDNCLEFGTVGTPYLKDVHMIVDPETGEEIYGYNKTGELYVSGPTLMQGYCGKSANENSDVIYLDEFGTKWYKTGDLAHFTSSGLVSIDGRIKRIITRRGFKIYPKFVEELILKNPFVDSCAVVGIDDPVELHIPVANIVLKDDYVNNSQIEQSVIDYIEKIISETLPEYDQIAGYNFLSELPLTPIGKIDFKKLESYGILNNEKRLQKKYRIM